MRIHWAVTLLFAVSLRADLLALGTHARSGLAHALIGSVAAVAYSYTVLFGGMFATAWWASRRYGTGDLRRDVGLRHDHDVIARAEGRPELEGLPRCDAVVSRALGDPPRWVPLGEGMVNWPEFFLHLANTLKLLDGHPRLVEYVQRHTQRPAVRKAVSG